MDNSVFDNSAKFYSCNLKARINLEKCKRCYKCVSRCPQNAIVMGENGYPKVDASKCNGCKMCEKSCIDFYYEKQCKEDSSIRNDSKLALVQIVEEFLKRYELMSTQTKLVVGFSGGYDSCVLLHILQELRKKYSFKLCAAHLNHGWRLEDADKEEINCKNFCDKFNIEFYSEKLSNDVAKTETAAREARYNFFIRCAEYFNTKNILTAHNRTDNAETLIYRIAKGTGVKGLCGIEEKRIFDGINIYRPILTISRDEIEAYCVENNLQPNIDSSNFDTKYKRNFVRHELIPMFEKINNNAKNAINSLSVNAKENEEIINEYLSLIKTQIFEREKIKTNKFLKLSKALKQKVIYNYIVEKDIDYDRKKILEIVEFIDDASKYKSGKTLSLTNDLWLFCSKKDIYFISQNNDKNDEIVVISDYKKDYFISNYKLSIEAFTQNNVLSYPKETENYVFVDLSNQDYLELRFRKAGDKIQPFGMKNIVKLKDFFINKSVPKHKKDKIVLLCNREEVLYACTVGLSEKLRVTTVPTHIIRIDEV